MASVVSVKPGKVYPQEGAGSLWSMWKAEGALAWNRKTTRKAPSGAQAQFWRASLQRDPVYTIDFKKKII